MYICKLKSNHISWESKIQLYKLVNIRETLTTVRAIELKLHCFGRKVLRKIYGPLLDINTKRYIPTIYSKSNPGNWNRQDTSKHNRMIYGWNCQSNPEGWGHPRRLCTRWKDDIDSDLKTMSYELDNDLMLNREGWWRIAQSAKTCYAL